MTYRKAQICFLAVPLSCPRVQSVRLEVATNAAPSESVSRPFASASSMTWFVARSVSICFLLVP
jgi:hypothetical protein